ncbi:MAG: universal stress protein [Halobacteria archaeon]
MYDKILLPTDMSKGVDEAIEHAVEASNQYGAELHVLYVVDADAYSSYPGDEYVHEFEGLEKALETSGQEAVGEITDLADGEGVETTTAIKYGVPHEEILKYVDEEDVDHVFIGSKKRPGEYRRLLGSVADRVVNMSEVPVTVVKTEIQ